MHVLHATWLAPDAGLGVWAEDDSRSRTAPARRGRPPRQPAPRPHPFALDADGIRLAVSELGGLEVGDLLNESMADLMLRLPDSGGGPMGSPWLDDDSLDRVSDTSSVSSMTSQSRWWTAPGFVLGRSEVVPFLQRLVAATGDIGGVAIADPSAIALAADFRYAALAAELVLELVTRGRVVPSLELDTDGWRARWRPLIDRQDRGRIEALLWTLPPSFMAGSSSELVLDDARSPTKLGIADATVRSFMWYLADALTRQFAADQPSGGRRRAAKSNAVDAWLAALVSPDGAVEADSGELAALADQLRAWHATENAAAESVRTCFRIVPPADGADGTEDRSDGEENDPGRPVRRRTKSDPGPTEGWRIEFALQAVDDPSLLVSAANVWADGPELVALERHVMHPDEVLLRGLGRAARLFPPLGPALAAATPCDQVIDGTGVLAFLRDGAPLLEEAGFGVLAPPWWRSSRKLSLRLKARTRSTSGGSASGVGLDALCDIRWEVALGDEKLGITELRELARLKQPLVRVRGQWVELRQEDLAAAITAVGKKGAAVDHMPAGEVLRTALGFEPTIGGLPVAEVEADGWLGDLLSGAEDRQLHSIPTPVGFDGKLRPYQERGLGWLAFLGELGLGACLADDMGLGKTAQLLALLVNERATAVRPHPGRGRSGNSKNSRPAPVPTIGPTLVLCPMSLVGNWQREAARFAPELSVYVHHGPDRLQGKPFARQAGRADLVLSTYGLAARDQQLLSSVPWRRMVLDEAQQIKNSAARTTQSVRAIPATSRIAMTGTPVENRLSELWSIMQFLNPGMLGSEKAFRDRFANPIERHGDDEAAARLRRITGPFVLRRLKTDRSIIADLPEKLEMKEFCNLTREQATLYQAVVDDMLARIDEAEGIERRGLVLATMLKLKQVCNHPAHFLADGSSLTGRSGKLNRLVEVLDEAVAEGDRSLVFTQFTEMGGMLERHLRQRLGCDVSWLHGGVSKKARDAMVERFQGDEGPPVFLLSLKAGGTGLNLTAATHVAHFDRWWNPAVEDQATDRAFRIGQKHNVQVRKFVCGGTLEERIDAMIEGKRALAERIVGTGEGWITEMSTEQLREVVALSADVVGED